MSAPIDDLLDELRKVPAAKRPRHARISLTRKQTERVDQLMRERCVSEREALSIALSEDAR